MLHSAITGCVDLMVREELLARARNDRQARHAYALGTVSSSAVEQIDADNLAFLTRQLTRHGWLGADLVGQCGADACWRLVQRTPVEQQLAWLPLMQAALWEGWAEEREATGAGVAVEGPRTGGVLRCGDPARLVPLATPERLSEMRAMVEVLNTRAEEWDRAHGYQVIAHVRRDDGGARLGAWWPDATSARVFVTALLRDLTKSQSHQRRRCWCEVWAPDETGGMPRHSHSPPRPAGHRVDARRHREAGTTELVLSREMTKGHADPARRKLNAHLSRGSVLVHLVDRTTPHARRVLLDAAARYLASAVALVRGADDKAGNFVAQLVGEGWSAAVVLW